MHCAILSYTVYPASNIVYISVIRWRKFVTKSESPTKKNGIVLFAVETGKRPCHLRIELIFVFLADASQVHRDASADTSSLHNPEATPAKAVSTISGYESDAHAIPLDVLASISSLFSISTDELLGLDAPEVLSLSGLTGAQKKTLIKLRNELLSPSQKGNDLSPQQMEILHDIIKAFG